MTSIVLGSCLGVDKVRSSLKLEIVFKGSLADDGQLQFYDASQALAGFERVIRERLINGFGYAEISA